MPSPSYQIGPQTKPGFGSVDLFSLRSLLKRRGSLRSLLSSVQNPSLFHYPLGNRIHYNHQPTEVLNTALLFLSRNSSRPSSTTQLAQNLFVALAPWTSVPKGGRWRACWGKGNMVASGCSTVKGCNRDSPGTTFLANSSVPWTLTSQSSSWHLFLQKQPPTYQPSKNASPSRLLQMGLQGRKQRIERPSCLLSEAGRHNPSLLADPKSCESDARSMAAALFCKWCRQ